MPRWQAVSALIAEVLKAGGAETPEAHDIRTLVERFDRRGTEPFELFRSEFGQNSWIP